MKKNRNITTHCFAIIIVFLIIIPTRIYADPLVAYVWDFTTRDRKKDYLTTNLTIEFEERLINSNCLSKVLDRRNYDRIYSQRNNEKKIQEIEGRIIKNMETNQANLVVFGEIYNDTQNGLIKITITLQSLNGDILAIQSDHLEPRYKLDPENRVKVIDEIIKKLCSSIFRKKPKSIPPIPSDPPTTDTESRITSIENTKGTIKCGDTIIGNINSVGESNELKFNAMNGEKISIAVSKLSTSALFNPAIEILNPSGRKVGHWQREGNHTFTLPSDGVYTIKVFDERNDGMGKYTIGLEPISAFFNGKINCAYSIECGETIKSTLASKNAADSYRFFAKAGEKIAIAITKLSYSALFNPAINLIDTSGNRVGNWKHEGNHTFTLQNDGPHLIRVLDERLDGKGTYSIRLEPVGGYFNGRLNCAQLIDCSESVEATLETKNAVDTYRFNGKPGEKISINLTNLGNSALFNPAMELISPSGSRVGNWKRQGNHSFILPRRGPYTIRIFDEKLDGNDKYQLSLKGSCSN